VASYLIKSLKGIVHTNRAILLNDSGN